MRGEKLGHPPLAARRQPYADDPAVMPVSHPPDEAGVSGAVHKFHRAVMPEQKVSGQVTDRRRIAARMPLHSYQQLVLDMRQPHSPGLLLAPVLKLPQPSPECEQVLEIRLGQLRHATSRPFAGATILPDGLTLLSPRCCAPRAGR